jgi:stage III sporulation protein SpoIIIAA
MPVIIIDEIGTELEVLARTIAEKGVQLGTTHGTV